VNLNSNNYTFLQVGSPDFGQAFNLTEVLESTGRVRMTWLKDLNDFADITVTFQGGTNATFDNDITGNSTWLEFNDARHQRVEVLGGRRQVAAVLHRLAVAAAEVQSIRSHLVRSAVLAAWRASARLRAHSRRLRRRQRFELGYPTSGGGEFVGPATLSTW
jgi:hypothetical protein